MPDMSVVAALELSHPVLLLVLMEANHAALHGGSLVVSRPASPAAAGVARIHHKPDPQLRCMPLILIEAPSSAYRRGMLAFGQTT